MEKIEKIGLKFCKLCNKKMPPIGNKRENGKSHNDWETREYHKKCFKNKCEFERAKKLMTILHLEVI